MLSKKNQALIEAYNKGYRAVSGKMWSPLSRRWLKGSIDKDGRNKRRLYNYV